MNDAVYKFRRYEDASLSYTGIDKHECESVGLFTTVLSREDYDRMNQQLSASMVAQMPDIYDLPDSPYSAQMDDENEEEEEIKPQPVKKSIQTPARPAIVQPSAKPQPSQPRTPITPYSRYSYVPPQPTKAAEPTKRYSATDLSKVVPGAKVKHKAFGEGTVKEITNNMDGSHYIKVLFGKVEKQFAFPSAFYDGFLSMKE